MIMTNVGSVPGKKIVEHFGIVQGSTVRAKHFGRDMMAGLKNLVGGEKGTPSCSRNRGKRRWIACLSRLA
jgi:uncharacterized protein YbjQ (UPF0145 family)